MSKKPTADPVTVLYVSAADGLGHAAVLNKDGTVTDEEGTHDARKGTDADRINGACGVYYEVP
jgi:hypothetical protein